MIINALTRNGEILKIDLQDSCYDRCENYINEYKRYLEDCNLNNIEDLNNATLESGKIRGKVNAYLLALYDLEVMNYYENAILREHYSNRITILYELWIEDYN